MSYQPTLKYIQKFIEEKEAKPPLDREKVTEWLQCEYLFEFFRNTTFKWILIHLHTKDFFLNSFTINSSKVERYRTKNSLNLDFPLKNEVISYGYSFPEGKKRHFVEQNYENGLNRSKMHPLFFHRIFDGYEVQQRSYYEILQPYLHFTDIHWVEERSAYCTLNDIGDLEEKIFIQDEENFSVILFERNELERYLLYQEEFLCRFLEIHRAMPNADWIGSANPKKIIKSSPDKNIWIRLSPYIPDNLNESCDLIKAAHIFLPTQTLEDLENPKKEYVSFITYDWKHKVIITNSCNPGTLDNYFQDTGKPFETSPVFFKSDVLLKYKNEPEKYELKERTIYCRGAWFLPTYDINSEGQVHTYIYYLSYLPYREQLHWKQYNENPKGSISERAYKNDFKAEFSNEYNPLELIKIHLRSFPPLQTQANSVVIWKPKEELETLLGKVHYVSSGKLNEYKDFLMSLTILIIDGLQTTELQKLVKLNPEFKEDTKSLGCLKLLLQDLKISEETINSIINPLRSLQEKRSKYAGHGGSKPNFDLVKDCRQILGEVEVSLKNLIDALKGASS